MDKTATEFARIEGMHCTSWNEIWVWAKRHILKRISMRTWALWRRLSQTHPKPGCQTDQIWNNLKDLEQGLQYQYQYQYQKSILGPSIPIPIPILSKFWPSIPIPIPRPLNTNTRGLNTTKVVLNLNFSNSALQIFEADFTKIKNIFRFYFILLDFKTKFYFGKLIFFAF